VNHLKLTSGRVSANIIVLSLLALAAAGCNPPAPAPAPKASPKACEDYSARICKESGGDESPGCTTIKAATELMPPEACAAGLANVDYTVKKLGDKRKKCDELTTKLCGDLGKETETCKMVETHTKSFPPERCEMMLSRYAEVLADLKKQEEKNKPLSPEKVAKMTSGENLASFGPKDAKVTLVEFSDFQCPFCSRAATATEEVRKKYGDKVFFVFRQFPLSFHQDAHLAAQASLAANAQGKFWEFHDKMFENQKALGRPALEGYAKDVGLNVATFKKALDEKTYAPVVDAEMKLGEEVAVDGTPTLFLNGKRVANPTDFAAISQEIEAALKAGG
jgi:protein-disulfide isomerase